MYVCVCVCVWNLNWEIGGHRVSEGKREREYLSLKTLELLSKETPAAANGRHLKLLLNQHSSNE